jgi:hypothetical protein
VINRKNEELEKKEEELKQKSEELEKLKKENEELKKQVSDKAISSSSFSTPTTTPTTTTNTTISLSNSFIPTHILIKDFTHEDPKCLACAEGLFNHIISVFILFINRRRSNCNHRKRRLVCKQKQKWSRRDNSIQIPQTCKYCSGPSTSYNSCINSCACSCPC